MTDGLVGVVDEGGIAGVTMDERLAKPSQVRAVFTLCPWQDRDGAVRTTELRVEMPVSKSRLNELMAAYKPLTTVSLSGVSAKEKVLDTPCVQADSLMLAGMSPELRLAHERLRAPVCVQDAVLGEFIYNRRFRRFEGRGRWCGKPVEIMLGARDQVEAREALKLAHEVWRDQRERDRIARAHAAGELLKVKNERWLEEGETPVSEAQFIGQMSAQSLYFYTDGRWELEFDDGDLFWGHQINVSYEGSALVQVHI
jgi:hypothetical protein